MFCMENNEKRKKESSLILRKAKFQAIFKFVLSSASKGTEGIKYNRISAFVSMFVLLIRSSLEKFFKKNFRDDRLFLGFAKILALVFTIAIITESRAACNGATATTAGTDEENQPCGTWDCGAQGSNVTCTLSKGTLTIAGEGEMRDYTHRFYGNESTYPRFNTSDAPWAGKYVTKAVIEGNVTRIGAQTFPGERYLTEISGMESVTSLGEGAFTRTGLTSIDISNVVEITNSDGVIGSAFHKARDLQYINMRADIKVQNDWFGDYGGGFAEVPALNGNKNNCTIENGYMICGSCGDKYVKAGTGCVTAENCGVGYYADEASKKCLCAKNKVFYKGQCLNEYPFAKKRWTPAEANEWLHDGNDNFVIITFKK